MSALTGSFFAASRLWRPQRACQMELEGRINPNSAPAASLVRLRGIGMSRAAAIVAYRESFRRSGEGGPAFQGPNDLQAVKGIGPKTVENIRQALKFE
ncbi:MAG: helix-hairpin-helix domain-containing protein [Phycisphaerales bacterium]|nr:MAG: helix-hairpin-helix domain-containing protein [Phycisphaerales bacterium]